MEKLMVSSSPHFNGGRTTQNIMLDVIIALTPAMIASVILFGIRAAAAAENGYGLFICITHSALPSLPDRGTRHTDRRLYKQASWSLP